MLLNQTMMARHDTLKFSTLGDIESLPWTQVEGKGMLGYADVRFSRIQVDKMMDLRTCVYSSTL